MHLLTITDTYQWIIKVQSLTKKTNKQKKLNKKIKQKKYLGIKMWESIISVRSIIVSKIPKCGFAWEKQDGIVLIS